MHERDTRSPSLAESAGADVRAPALRPAEAMVLQLQREAGNRVTRGIVKSKLKLPPLDLRPPGAAEFAKLLGDQAVRFGQFTFTNALAAPLNEALAPHMGQLSAEDQKWLRARLDELDASTGIRNSQTAAKVAADAITTIKTGMKDKGAAGAAIAKLMGDPTETGIGFGGALYLKLWKEYGKPGAATPDVTQHLTYAKLSGLNLYEMIACKDTTERLGAKVGAGRGGEGRRSAGTAIAKGTSIASDIQLDHARSKDFLALGNVVVYGNDLGKWVRRMRDALDDGWTVHARCISGSYGGGKGGREPDHSVLIYGYGGPENATEFYFFDPDIGGTGGLTPGWGRIYHDAAAGHLSTARTDADFRAYTYETQAEHEVGSAAGHESGYQASGVHRYQVKEIWTM
jgi:hypothetical protein